MAHDLKKLPTAAVGNIKIHMGCGSVYLVGTKKSEVWVNVDVPSDNAYTARERPDLVKMYATTEDDYYGKIGAKPTGELKKMAQSKQETKETVYDEPGSFFNYPYAYGTVSEILSRQVFEHMSLTEARMALQETYEVMRLGGVLRLDVPDTEETLKLLMEKQDPFYARHLMGPRRNDYGYHIMSYTREGFKALVEEYGFDYEAEEDNIHFYPAFCLRFRKPAPSGVVHAS